MAEDSPYRAQRGCHEAGGVDLPIFDVCCQSRALELDGRIQFEDWAARGGFPCACSPSGADCDRFMVLSVKRRRVREILTDSGTRSESERLLASPGLIFHHGARLGKCPSAIARSLSPPGEPSHVRRWRFMG